MSERVVGVGTQNYTKVIAMDPRGHGGANHKYIVVDTSIMSGFDCTMAKIYARVDFQNGPIKESGINGCHNEDLLAIVIDRLQGFQDGEYACRSNDLALRAAKDALTALSSRTAERKSRGVEGTHEV